MSNFEGKDLGNTEKAGGSRFSTGKAPLVSAPVKGLLEVGRISDMGGKKYAPFDWKEGQSFSTLLNSAMRHMLEAISAPLARDKDSGRLHVGHAAWNLLCLLHFVEEGMDPVLDDVSCWHGVTAAMKDELEERFSITESTEPYIIKAAVEELLNNG